MTPILLTIACAVCAAAIAALPGPAASANSSADAGKIVSALSLVPKAVTAWEQAAGQQAGGQQAGGQRTAGRRRGSCAPPVALPALGLKPVLLGPACPRRPAGQAGAGPTRSRRK